MEKMILDKEVQQKVTEALRYRGYFVNVKEDGIYLSSSNHKDDLHFFKRWFEELGVSSTNEGKVGWRSDLDIEKVVDKIRFMPGRNHEAGGTAYWGKWKYFVRRKHGPKIRTITLDPGIALLTKAISAAGIATIMCCDGHGRRAPYVMFDGEHNGIWFDLIQKQWMQVMELNYQWVVSPCRNNWYMVLQAKKEKKQSWDLSNIQEDAYRISEFLLDKTEELSELKRHVFGKGIRPTKRLIAEMTTEDKQKWMAERWKEYFQKSGSDCGVSGQGGVI